MALEFLSNLWNVIKREFWNSDECSEDEVTRPETKDSGVPISRQNVDSKDGVGRDSKNYMFSCREYDYGDDFINNFVDEINRKHRRNDLTWNGDYNTLRHFQTSDDNAYRYLNGECLNKNRDNFYVEKESKYYYPYGGSNYRHFDEHLNYTDEGELSYKMETYSYDGLRCYDGYRYDNLGRRLDSRSYPRVEQKRFSKEHIQQKVHSKDNTAESLFKTASELNYGIHVIQSSNLQHDHQFMRNLLFAFYDLLVKNLCRKLSLSDFDIEKGIEKLVFNYGRLNKCRTPETLNFNDMATCVGYLHRYAICHAALVYHAVIELLSSETLFLSVFSRRKLEMVCLGSGPGNDFIGFAFALLNSSLKISNVDVTIVDKCFGWFTVFSETIAMFNSLVNNAYKEPRKTFLQADLTNISTWCSTMREKLHRAHIVSLVKVLSNISEEDHFLTLTNIVRLMKDDAFLIIIDCPLPSAELSALEHFLQPVYSSDREKFNFKEKKTRFGYPNISQCTAYTRVYRKRNSVLFR